MADFVLPTPIYLGRRSVMNDLGLGTILGNGSPVSPRWTYYRERAWSDEDDDTGRRGTAPNVEPPPGSPEYQSALLQGHGHADGAVLPAASIAIPMGSAVGATQAAGAMGSRLAPAASGLAAGATVLLTPTNTPATTYELGNGLRARSAPGQRSVSIERRVDDGLLGTGVGAKWERLDVDAEVGPGPDGIVGLNINRDQLKATIGDEAASRVLGNAGGKNDLPPPAPMSLPSKIEMRIGVSTDQGSTTVPREATRDEVLGVCPRYAEYEQYGMDAAAKYKAAGFDNGMEYGRLVHGEVKSKLADIQARLEERGLVELKPELALRRGEPNSYSKGSSRLDILELHRDHITVCVYELKTGGATIPRETMLRYVREAGLYAKAQGEGYKHIYFIPIHVP